MPETSESTAADWTGWRTVLWLGVVSLLVDLVYEGARSITGPFLASLGASALTVGLVTGAGEAAALGFRLFSGPAADRSGRYWRWMVVGYALTALCVPLMALAPALGAAGLAFGASMVLLERTGKAIRSPAKSVLLAVAARRVGRGRGFGVHKALDQTGAFLGPLVVAGMIAWTAHTWTGLAVLAVPGALALGVLAWLHRYVADPARAESTGVSTSSTNEGARSTNEGARSTNGRRWLRSERQRASRNPATVEGAALPPLPRVFHVYAVACALTTAGLMTFGVISFHLVHERLVTAAVVPVVYAAAMAADALASLATGFAYDHIGGSTLLVLPVVVAVVPALVFTDAVTVAVVGVLLWGAATGVQDSTVKALVADLVPTSRLATSYGAFAAYQAVAALAGGGLAGWLYDSDRTALVVTVAGLQVVALALLVGVLVRGRRSPESVSGRRLG